MSDTRGLTSSPSQRLMLAFELYEIAEAMFRQRLRRQNPLLTSKELDERVSEWLAKRPGAEDGDSVGRPVEWPSGD